MSTEHTPIMPDQPDPGEPFSRFLQLLRGGVRPVLTLIGFIALTAGFLSSKVAADTYVPMVSMMIAFWFATRNRSTG